MHEQRLRVAAPINMRSRLVELCLPLVCILSFISNVSSFLAGFHPMASRRGPAACHASRQLHMTGTVSTTAIAWPDAMPTPSLEQPIRSRVVAVAPSSVDSPFSDRGKPVPWLEVGFTVQYDGANAHVSCWLVCCSWSNGQSQL